MNSPSSALCKPESSKAAGRETVGHGADLLCQSCVLEYRKARSHIAFRDGIKDGPVGVIGSLLAAAVTSEEEA